MVLHLCPSRGTSAITPGPICYNRHLNISSGSSLCDLAPSTRPPGTSAESPATPCHLHLRHARTQTLHRFLLQFSSSSTLVNLPHQPPLQAPSSNLHSPSPILRRLLLLLLPRNAHSTSPLPSVPGRSASHQTSTTTALAIKDGPKLPLFQFSSASPSPASTKLCGTPIRPRRGWTRE